MLSTWIMGENNLTLYTILVSESACTTCTMLFSPLRIGHMRNPLVFCFRWNLNMKLHVFRPFHWPAWPHLRCKLPFLFFGELIQWIDILILLSPFLVVREIKICSLLFSLFLLGTSFHTHKKECSLFFLLGVLINCFVYMVIKLNIVQSMCVDIVSWDPNA